MVHQSTQSNPISHLQQLQMADHQNSGGFTGVSNAGLIPVQHAWVYGEKAPWCLNGSSVIHNKLFYTCIILDAVNFRLFE